MKIVKSCSLEDTYIHLFTLLWDGSFNRNTQRHRQTDRQSDDIIMPTADDTAFSTIDIID